MKNAIKGISILTTLLSSKSSDHPLCMQTVSLFLEHKPPGAWTSSGFLLTVISTAHTTTIPQHEVLCFRFLQFTVEVPLKVKDLINKKITVETLRDSKTQLRLPKNCLFILVINSAIEDFSQTLGIITAFSSSHSSFLHMWQSRVFNSKILSEGNIWEYSICISFIVEVNQNTQGTQREFSDKSSKFYFSSQPQGYELSHLHKEQHTPLQDLDSQLLLMAVSFQHLFEKQINAAPLLTVSREQQLVFSTSHTLPSWQEPPAFPVSPWSSAHLSITPEQFYFLPFI